MDKHARQVLSESVVTPNQHQPVMKMTFHL